MHVCKPNLEQAERGPRLHPIAKILQIRPFTSSRALLKKEVESDTLQRLPDCGMCEPAAYSEAPGPDEGRVHCGTPTRREGENAAFCVSREKVPTGIASGVRDVSGTL